MQRDILVFKWKESSSFWRFITEAHVATFTLSLSVILFAQRLLLLVAWCPYHALWLPLLTQCQFKEVVLQMPSTIKVFLVWNVKAMAFGTSVHWGEDVLAGRTRRIVAENAKVIWWLNKCNYKGFFTLIFNTINCAAYSRYIELNLNLKVEP